MVSFVCSTCQGTFKKSKLVMHAKRCRNATYACIDCGVDFVRETFREHSNCISEAEKHQGKLYKPKQDKSQQKPKSTVDQLTAKAQQLASSQAGEQADAANAGKKRKHEQVSAKEDTGVSGWESTDISGDAVQALAGAIAYSTSHEPDTAFGDLKKKCVKLVTKHPKSKLSKSDVKDVFDKALLAALSEGKVVLAAPKSA
ncbi:hypothetical protein LPJ63_001280 [Coemansia sp. RSA 2711]|nr:hypothetical protein LPJ63_001280 [Coemansia sp. RSA 2711]